MNDFQGLSEKSMYRTALTALLITSCWYGLGASLVMASQPFPNPYLDTTPRQLELIPPGVVVTQHAEHGWSDLVTIAHPRLGAGAVDSIPEFAGRYASMFKFTVLANVRQAPVNGQPQYWLDKLAIGLAMDVKGQSIVVTKDTAAQFGGELGMIERGVLGGNEDSLKDIKQIARTERLIMFDAQANMAVGDEHEMMVLRHLVWVSPNTGKLGILVWLLEEDKDNAKKYALAEPQMQLLPPGYQEDRVIHVSEGGLLSRIPTPDRFALLSVPPGTAVPFSDEMSRVAGLKAYDREDLQRLVAGVGQSIAQLKARVAQRQ